MNGFSGLAPVDYYYYALFAVINTTVFPIAIYIGCPIFDFDYEKYGKEI